MLRAAIVLLINTPLQWGVGALGYARKRFNGFARMWKTVETVFEPLACSSTLLKQCVNESRSGVISRSGGFTLIEIMVVCGIMAIIMTISIPMLRARLYPDSIQKVANDLRDACCHARAYAILQGTPVDLVITLEDESVGCSVHLQPAANEAPAAKEGDIFSPSVSGGAWRMEDRARGMSRSSIGDDASMGEGHVRSGAPPEALNFTTVIPPKIYIEDLEVNFSPDAREWAEVRVRFYPNGTSDEFKLLLYRPDTNERRLLTLEVVTALPDVESDLSKMNGR